MINPFTLVPEKARQWIYLGYALVILAGASAMQMLAVVGIAAPAWLGAALSVLMAVGFLFGITAASTVKFSDPAAVRDALSGPLVKIPDTVRQTLYGLYSTATAVLFVLPAFYPHADWIVPTQALVLYVGAALGFTASANVPSAVEVVPKRALDPTVE